MQKIKTFQGRNHEDVANAVNFWLEANTSIIILDTQLSTASATTATSNGSPYITIMITYKEI